MTRLVGADLSAVIRHEDQIQKDTLAVDSPQEAFHMFVRNTLPVTHVILWGLWGPWSCRRYDFHRVGLPACDLLSG